MRTTNHSKVAILKLHMLKTFVVVPQIAPSIVDETFNMIILIWDICWHDRDTPNGLSQTVEIAIYMFTSRNRHKAIAEVFAEGICILLNMCRQIIAEAYCIHIALTTFMLIFG